MGRKITVNKYVRIPRGHSVNSANDEVLEIAIEAIGDHYMKHLPGKAWNRGRRYIKHQIGCSCREVKLLHKPQESKDYDVFGNNYSHYSKISRFNAERILLEIISLCKEIPDDVIQKAAQDRGIDINKPQILQLFEESLDWMRRALHNSERLDEFNDSPLASVEVRRIRNALLDDANREGIV